MIVRRICVSGTGVNVAVVGALVARRCAGPGCEVVIAVKDDPNGDDRMLARPAWRRFHHDIGLDPAALAQVLSASPAFVTQILANGASALIPFAPAGQARGGAEFHQHWLRANGLVKQPPLDEFSPALPLARDDNLTLDQAAQSGLEHGLAIGRKDYAGVLLQQAQHCGARVVGYVNRPDATLHIASRDEAGPSLWQGARVQIGAASAIPGLGWQSLYDAANRLLALSADPAKSAPEQREFNRLSAASAERMEDFASFALSASPLDTQRPALRRKITVFQACGRIPLEDYEVLAAHEWLALFWAKGLRPARHDRLADVMPGNELLHWLEKVHRSATARRLQEQTA